MKKNTVFLSDDHAVFRNGLRLLLEGTDDIDIIGEAARLLKQWQNRARKSKSTAAPALTGRQTEVLKMIAEGYPTKRIARLLALSIKTIEKHRQSLMDKLDIHEIATLTRYAVASGAVEPFPVGCWRAGARAAGGRPRAGSTA